MTKAFRIAVATVLVLCGVVACSKYSFRSSISTRLGSLSIFSGDGGALTCGDVWR
jgi:hypothetical protein